MEIKERIVNGSEDLFKRHGVKSVTMDDIARHLGVSKKTIYQFFSNKDELINEVISFHLEKQEKIMDDITNKSIDPVDQLLKLTEYFRSSFQNINPNLMYEVEKYYPAAWNIFLEHKSCCIHETIVSTLLNGIEQGYFRKDQDVEILAIMRMEMIHLGFNPNIFPAQKFKLSEVQGQLLDHFLHGICTLKGHKLINKYKHIIEEE